MENLSDELSNLMINKKFGERFKSLANEVFQDKEVKRFLSSHNDELDHSTIIKSISKLYEFVRERNKVNSGEESTIPGYQPKLELSKNAINVAYVPTKEKIESIRANKMLKKMHLVALPDALRKINFDSFYNDNNQIRANAYDNCLQFISDYEENPKSYHQGIYLYGEFGVGKTFLMAAMANELVKNGHEVMLLHFPSFVTNIKGSIQNNTVSKKVGKIKMTPLLILDDIGADDMSSWIRDDIFSVILEYRMQNELPTFFTSNYSMDQFENNHLKFNNKGDEEPLKAQRIMQRIHFLSKEVQMTGYNRRPQ
ncbi:primosomal protein DnaI [Apilactobacillus apisilvae]|uniref:Primosomal protein DnaI n=1 Tax=Apilactobacillus apisilvae TaxID=2923364 RepID=A0ABY4PI32_9LACO|nr:primosomal protein DnaI [Apilactobacillus apisilvae]UQS85268.1 primosomal protein DnaI [Apilactobacillus apisilvae]